MTKAISAQADCKFDVVNEGTAFPEGFESMPFPAGGGILNAIRYAGGCTGIGADIVAGMPGFFVDSHRGIRNLIAFSGGTMEVEEGFDDVAKRTVLNPINFTITYVPSTLKAAYGDRNVLAVSTTPRTDQMTLDRNFGGLYLSGTNRVDFRQDHAIVIQADATAVTEADWSKDLIPYLNLLKIWQSKGVKVAVVACNGGGVTKKEIYWALERGIPVIAIKGSGRQTDIFIEAFEKGEAKVRNAAGDEVVADPALVSIASFADPEGMRNILIARGFIVDEIPAAVPAVPADSGCPA